MVTVKLNLMCVSVAHSARLYRSETTGAILPPSGHISVSGLQAERQLTKI